MAADHPTAAVGTDNLSRMNDDVLHHILSFIPDTEHKARTAVLCRRFRHLWAEHDAVRLGLADDATHDVVDRCCGPSVDRVVSLFRWPFLRTLEASLHACCADRLLRFAAARSLADLRVSSARNLPIPTSLLDCGNLWSLYVTACTIPPTPDDFSGFPFLACINIYCSTIVDRSLASLLRKCPALRSLRLVSCHSLAALDITSATLAELAVLNCEGLKSVRVDAPSLTSLGFEGDADRLFLKNVPRLSGVTVRHARDAGVPVVRAEWERKVADLYRTAEKACMDEWLFRFVLPTSPDSSFGHLRRLTCRVEWVTASMLRGLVAVLERSTSLEHLCINLWCGTRKEVLLLKEAQIRWLDLLQNDREEQVWDPPESGRECCRALKSVVVKGFMGTANEMRMAEYLLHRGAALETLTLAKCLAVTDANRESLARAPRASLHVRIQILPVTGVNSIATHQSIAGS